MALKGDLKDFRTAQLLNLINLARKTGALTVRSNSSTMQAFFREGKLIRAGLIGSDDELTGILTRAGKITQEQARAIKAHARINTDKELGMLLINAGYVSQQDILRGVRQHTLDAIYQLFSWIEGEFQFEATQLPPPDQITIPVELENIIIEGSRRVQEWEQLLEELPDLDKSLKFAEQPQASLRSVNLSADEWRVISCIGPANTMRRIAEYNSLNDFQIRKIVHGLLTTGLVALVEPAKPRPRPGQVHRDIGRVAAPASPIETRPPDVKRSVILRLIDRIRRI